MPVTDKQSRIRVDWGLIAVLFLTLFTTIPLLSHTGLPNGSDVLYHTYRVAEMSRSWDHGVIFPHWAEGLYFGYGSPLFHFYASLTYYSTSLLIRIFGMSALEALRVMIVLSMLGCSGGMYLFAKMRLGQLGGVIAGLVYVYSPYLMYTEPYARGTYPELLAFALFPFLLWRIEHLLQHRSIRNFLSVVILQVVLIHAHNLMALTLTGLALAWILWEGVISQINLRSSHAQGRASIWAFVAVSLGMGLSAGFWLPVLLESDTVNLQNLTGVALLDYRNFFLPFGDLLAFPPRHDAGAINGLRELSILGIAQWGLPLVGVIVTGAMYTRGYRSNHPRTCLGTVFLVIMALLLIFLMTPTASTLWDSIRALQFLQFPWRLLGVVAVCLAWLAGLNALWIERLQPRLQIALIAGVVAVPIVSVIPLFYVPEWRNTEVDTSISAYHASERAGLQLGTTFTDEYRPHDAFNIPDATDELIADYADGYPIDKFNHKTLPQSATLEWITNNPEYLEWRIDTDEAFTAEILNFYWAGWRAEIDGQAVEITPSLHHGLITFSIPAGNHSIKVYLGSTPARDLGMVITVGSVVIVVILCILLWRGKSPTARHYRTSIFSREQWIGIALGGGIALLSVFALFREGVAWQNSPAGTALPASDQEQFMLDDSFKVLGYDVNSRQLSAGDRLIVRIYWYALQTSDVNFSSFLHVSTGGPPVAQIDKLHPGGRAIREWWSPEGYIIDEYDLYLPQDLQSGEYQLYIGLYTCELMPAGACGNGYRPTVVNEKGQAVGDTVPLGTIEVR